MNAPTARPLVYSLETEKTERGVNLYITPPHYVEITAQREHVQPSRWMLGAKQKERIECAVMESRAIYITANNERQISNIVRWFQAEFG